jgi:hypothetical protein
LDGRKMEGFERWKISRKMKKSVTFFERAIFRASTMETLNFEVLNGSHMDTSLFNNFLIIVLNR